MKQALRRIDVSFLSRMFRSRSRDVKGPGSSLAISSPGIWHYARAANELALSEPVLSLKQAIDRGVRVRVIVDHRKYEALPSEQVMGSISLSPDSPTYNREVGLILDDTHFVRTLRDRFEMDFKSKRHAY